MFVSLTHDSKVAGDEGIYAAIEAARLARALRGATIRPSVRSIPPINPNSIPLATPPKKWEVMSLCERGTLEILGEISNNDTAVLNYLQQVPVAIPDDTLMEELRMIAPFLRHVKPHPVVNFDDVKRLSQLMTLHGANITCLNLGDGAVMPHEHVEASPATVVEKMDELKARFPLPTPHPKKKKDDSDEDDEEEDEVEVDLKNNEELRAWCQSQELEYTDYDNAIRLRASYELDAFRKICDILMQDEKIRVLLLNHNQLGAPKDGEERVSLVPLRLLAKVIDANQTIKVLDLSSNGLGPHGLGIVGKALTKNIAIVSLDLSDNQLSTPAADVEEDPEYQGEDPVFGETYNGLEAISEVLKKNKFLKFLRLGYNEIHSGAEGEEPPITDPAEMDPENDAMTPDVESWQDLPLWRLVGPLRDYHRLRALDLTGNVLGPEGARMVATALADNHSIEMLDLTGNQIGFRGLHYIAKLVLASPHSVLHTLILRRNELGGKKSSKAQQRMALAAMDAMAAAIKNNNRLRRLSIAGNHLGPSLSSAMLATIGSASALEELDIEGNDACGDVASPHDVTVLRFIAAALYATTLSRIHPSIKVLHLGNNNIQAAGTNILFPVHDMLPISLTEVDLTRNGICKDFQGVNRLLIGSPVLRRLVLAYNGITSASTLIHGLSLNKSLVELDLSHNKLGSLKEQYCSDPKAQLMGVENLMEVLIKHPSLENINLSYNDFGATHGPLLARLCGLSNVHSHLRRLDLSGNPEIEQEVIEKMVRAIGTNSQMEVFYVSSPYGATAKNGGPLLQIGGDIAEENPVQMRSQQLSLTKLLRDTVYESSSLLDINCDLQRWFGNGKLSETADGAAIEEMQRRLLLNALLAA